jgi:hypothetical protein
MEHSQQLRGKILKNSVPCLFSKCLRSLLFFGCLSFAILSIAHFHSVQISLLSSMISLRGTLEGAEKSGNHFSKSGNHLSETTNYSSLLEHSSQQHSQIANTSDGLKFEKNYVDNMSPLKIHSTACRKWGVTMAATPNTTDTMRRIANATGWCIVVIVAEEQSIQTVPDIYWFTRKHYNQCCNTPGAVGDFCRTIPWEFVLYSSTMKNLGYLYAVLHNAEEIFEFDEKFDLEEQAIESVDDPSLNQTRVVSLGPNLFNPYPLLLNTSVSPNITNKPYSKQGEVVFEKRLQQDFGILHFTPTSLDMIDQRPLLVPKYALTPMDTSITKFTKSAFWVMPLPSSLSEGISKHLLRSCIAQCLFRDTESSRVVLSTLPGGTSINYETKRVMGSGHRGSNTSKLLEFLEAWLSLETSMEARTNQLWKDLCTQGFLSERDVGMMSHWLQVIIENNNTLPAFRLRHSNVVLMGQFNYGDVPIRSIIFWVQTWKDHFPNIVVRGPFSNETLNDLEAHGIVAFTGRDDAGYHSPLENLMWTLEDFQGAPGIDGVLYLHDDALLNMTDLTHGRNKKFPTESMIGNSCPTEYFHELYQDPRTGVPNTLFYNRTYKIYPNGTSANLYGETFSGSNIWRESLPAWPHYKRSLGGQTYLAMDPASARYREEDGSILFSPWTQADFFFVPTRWTDEFARATRLHLSNNPVFLEAALSTIADMIRRKQENASVTTIALCSSFRYRYRGTPKMILECAEDNAQTYGMYHPFKLSSGLEEWSDMFGTVQKS